MSKAEHISKDSNTTDRELFEQHLETMESIRGQKNWIRRILNNCPKCHGHRVEILRENEFDREGVNWDIELSRCRDCNITFTYDKPYCRDWIEKAVREAIGYKIKIKEEKMCWSWIETEKVLLI